MHTLTHSFVCIHSYVVCLLRDFMQQHTLCNSNTTINYYHYQHQQYNHTIMLFVCMFVFPTIRTTTSCSYLLPLKHPQLATMLVPACSCMFSLANFFLYCFCFFFSSLVCWLSGNCKLINILPFKYTYLKLYTHTWFFSYMYEYFFSSCFISLCVCLWVCMYV